MRSVAAAHPHRAVDEAESGCDDARLRVRSDERIERRIGAGDAEWPGGDGKRLLSRRRGRCEGEQVDEKALKALVRAAVALNVS